MNASFVPDYLALVFLLPVAFSKWLPRAMDYAVSWPFRAHRYGPDYPGLQGRDLDPDRYANLNRLYNGK